MVKQRNHSSSARNPTPRAPRNGLKRCAGVFPAREVGFRGAGWDLPTQIGAHPTRLESGHSWPLPHPTPIFWNCLNDCPTLRFHASSLGVIRRCIYPVNVVGDALYIQMYPRPRSISADPSKTVAFHYFCQLPLYSILAVYPTLLLACVTMPTKQTRPSIYTECFRVFRLFSCMTPWLPGLKGAQVGHLSTLCTGYMLSAYVGMVWRVEQVPVCLVVVFKIRH